MFLFITHFRMPPVCPTDLAKDVYQYVTHPSTFFFLCVLVVASLIFGLITLINYNKVKVFDTNIRTPNISNNLWIFYFFSIFARAVVACFRYSFPELQVSGEDKEMIVLGIILGLHGIGSLALALAFYHQHRYRSSGASNKLQHESTILQTEHSMYSKKIVTIVEVVLTLLFLLYLVGETLIILNRNSNEYYYVFISSFVLQRVPIVILMLVIIIYNNENSKTNDKKKKKNVRTKSGEQYLDIENEESEQQVPNMDDGPNGRAKLFLVFATIFNVCGDLPLEVWSDLLPTSCPIRVASYVDLFLFFYVLSLLFFFLFLRAEYERKKEECMWQFVSKFQDDFNFKRF